MKNLLELNPRWLRTSIYRLGMGMAFDCPHCLTQRITVWFQNPLDGGAAHTDIGWIITGNTFANISLVQMIKLAGHWEGVITNGKLT